METEQKRPEKSRKLQSGKTSNCNPKSVTEKQNNKNSCNLSETTKTQKGKESEISVQKQGTKGYSSNALVKNKEKTENRQHVNKADANKDCSKKQAKKRNKNNTNLLVQPLPLYDRVKEGTGESEKKNELVNAQVSSKKEASKIQNELVTKRTGSEVSKSKKRRIRKKRVLESLGISIINSVNTDKSKSSKKKKKKKSKFVKNPELRNENILTESINIKSEDFNEIIANGFIERSKDSTCDNTGGKGAVKKSEGTAKANDINIPCIKKNPEVPKTKDIKLEKVLEIECKGNKVTSDNNVPTKLSSSHQKVQHFKIPEKELSQPEAKNRLEDTPHRLVNKNKDDSPTSSGKSDLVNFLSHDNVEGLFRSALMNDATLSSRCSEKEVKNFFNTYGTFSERGRTQFATVEKLLKSSNKDSEDIGTSQYFEPVLDKQTLKNLNTVTNKESSYDIKTQSVASVTTPKCEYLSPKILKDSINTEEPLRVPPYGNSESESSYNQIVKSLNSDSIENISVFKGSLYRGPIYTSPNLENIVTNSSNSSQIPNSTSRVFVSNTHPLHELNHQDKLINSHLVPEQENSEIDNLSVIRELSFSNTSQDKDTPKEKNKKKYNFKEEKCSLTEIASPTTKHVEEVSVNLQSSVSTNTRNTCGSDNKDSCSTDEDKSNKNIWIDNKKDKTVEKPEIYVKTVESVPTDHKNDICINITSDAEKDACVKNSNTEDKNYTSKKSRDTSIESSYCNNKQSTILKKVHSEGKVGIKNSSIDNEEGISVEKTYANKIEQSITNACIEHKQDTATKKISTTEDKKYLSIKDACTDKNDVSAVNENKDSCPDKNRSLNKTCSYKTVANTCTNKEDTSIVKATCADKTSYIKDICTDKEEINVIKNISTDKKNTCVDRNDSNIKNTLTGKKVISGVKNICSDRRDASIKEEDSSDKSSKTAVKNISSEKRNTTIVAGTCTNKKDTGPVKEINTDKKNTSAPTEICTNEKSITAVEEICINKKDINAVKEFSIDKKDTLNVKEICTHENYISAVKEFNTDKNDISSIDVICTDRKDLIAAKGIVIDRNNTRSVKEICTDKKDTSGIKKISTDKKNTSDCKEVYTDKEDSNIDYTCTKKKDANVLEDNFVDKKDTDLEDIFTDKKKTSVENVYSDENDKSIKKTYIHDQKSKSLKKINVDSKKDTHTKEICNVDKVIASHKLEINNKPESEAPNRTDYNPKSQEVTRETGTKPLEYITSSHKVEKVICSEVDIEEEYSVYKAKSENSSTLHNNLSDTSNKEIYDITDNIETAVPVSILNTSDNNTHKLLGDNITMKSIQVKPTVGGNLSKTEKTHEEILAEREAKKAAKLATKNKAKGSSSVLSKADNTDILPKNASGANKNVKLEKSTTDTNKSNRLRESTEAVSGNKQEVKTEDKSVSNKTNQKSEEKMAPIIGKDDTQSKAELLIKKTEMTAGKSKAELRAERRAMQEAQRAAKAAQQQTKTIQAKPVPQVPTESKEKSPKKEVGDEVNRKTTTILVPGVKPRAPEHRVKLFSHLYHERGPVSISENYMLSGPDLHPTIVKLGMQYADRLVVGSNARCIALLDALKQVLRDYETPPQKEFSRGLEAELQPSVAFLDTCRPLSVSMTNALRHLMRQLTLLPNNVSDSEAKKKLLDAIDTYIREQIDMAAQAICNMVQRKIANGDVILTYGCSSLLQRILLEAHASGTKFKVIIVDGRPWNEGREMLRRLIEHGLDCSYVLVTAASFIMREATKVLLGAHALLANGYVMSRAGSSQVALLAHSYNVPVLVCCETHKFCERVQTDSFVYNELGNPDDLIPAISNSKEVPLSKWKSIGSLTPLNLTYDVTPPDLVSAVITELAILPCTSVPVILRIKPSEIGC